MARKKSAGHNRGLHPVRLFHLSQRLHRRGHRRLAKLLQSVNFFVFKTVLPPEVEGGEGLALNHRGLNVVINPRVTLGRRVALQHNVTLATNTHARDPRRMVVGDEVMIGAHAIALGPITIGRHAVIGAGSVVLRDVPAGEVWAGNPAKFIRLATLERDRPWLIGT